MTPSLNRRSFFAAIASFLAALFAPKKVLSAQTWPKPVPQISACSWMEGGHKFYRFWPVPEPQTFVFDTEVSLNLEAFNKAYLEPAREKYLQDMEQLILSKYEDLAGGKA